MSSEWKQYKCELISLLLTDLSVEGAFPSLRNLSLCSARGSPWVSLERISLR